MSQKVLERRRRERAALLERARRYADATSSRVPSRAVVVLGSVARGDFNAWSDIDVLVIAEGLPAGARERLTVLHSPEFPGIEPVGWTPAELHARIARDDPIAVEAIESGIVVHGSLAGLTA